MSMRTPLGRVRGLGSAGAGTEHFWRQRLTAIANIPLTIFLVWLLASLHGADHAVVIGKLSSPLIAIGLLLCTASMLYHMRLGLQVVIEDYVQNEGTKIVLLIANTLFVAAIAIASAFAILKLGFGG